MAALADARSTIDSYEDAPSLSPPAAISLQTLHTSLLTSLNSGDPFPIHSLLCEDVRLQEALGGGAKGVTGKDAVGAKVADVCGKMAGLIQGLEGAVVLGFGDTTRTVVTLKKGFVTLSLGVSATWMGGMIKLLVLQKSCDGAKFVAGCAPVEEEAAGEEGGADAGADEGDLEPPFLVPRPPSFPPPTVSFSIQSCSGLVNNPSRVALRPINSYVKVKLPGGARSQIDVFK
ncbi:hypothetical protein TeGR_g10574, partial [Tetraparma gracilis]